MLIFLFRLILQLVVTCLTVAAQVILFCLKLFGSLLGWLLALIWRRGFTEKLPLRAPGEIASHREEPTPATPPTNGSTFTPRPLRPRPRR